MPLPTALDLESILKSREGLRWIGKTPPSQAPGLREKLGSPCQGYHPGKERAAFLWKAYLEPGQCRCGLEPRISRRSVEPGQSLRDIHSRQITVTPEGLNITLSPSAKDQDLESALACLFNKQHILSGSYTLTGNLAAKGKDGEPRGVARRRGRAKGKGRTHFPVRYILES